MEKDYLRGQRTAAVFVLKDARDAATVRPALLAALSSLRPRSLYQIEDRSDITTLVNGLFGGLALVLGFIATISVVVAGVGIMNVMLVSVTERTREIGIRKAIGARPSQIVLQFLSEAILLTLIGATAGVTVGLVAGWLITTRYIVMVSGVIVPIPWKESVLLASGYALAIALTFGTYPAYRASRLDPIDALRYE
jgi:putative ABC transport system permease protein